LSEILFRDFEKWHFKQSTKLFEAFSSVSVTEASLKVSLSVKELTNDRNYSVISFFIFTTKMEWMNKSLFFSYFLSLISQWNSWIKWDGTFFSSIRSCLVTDKWLNLRKVKICKRGLTNLRTDINNELRQVNETLDERRCFFSNILFFFDVRIKQFDL
jgi:hypothetical protein